MKVKSMPRDIDSILMEANKSKALDQLIKLWNEIVSHKKQYSLFEIWKANNKIRMLALTSKGEDIEKGKFYNELHRQAKLLRIIN